MQAIYVMETILYNEVGTADAPDALERRDVAQVINNRYENNKYNTLSKTDAITPYLNAKKLNLKVKERRRVFSNGRREETNST